MSAPNNLLFISVFNKGSIELAKNHIASLSLSGITNFVCYVTDQESHDILKTHNIPCVLLRIGGETIGDISTEKIDFGTEDFNNLSYLRYYVISDLLKTGKDVWYLDTDTVVLADLNLIYNIIKALPDHKDIYFQNDLNSVCTGCALYMNNPKTIQCVKSVIANKTKSQNDQVIMQGIVANFTPEHFDVGAFSIHMFPCGQLFFREPYVKKDMRYIEAIAEYEKEPNKNTVFVHANWMIGNENKIEALKAHGLWYLKDEENKVDA